MRNRYVLLADIAAIASAAFGAFVLRFDWMFFRYRAEFPLFLRSSASRSVSRRRYGEGKSMTEVMKPGVLSPISSRSVRGIKSPYGDV